MTFGEVVRRFLAVAEGTVEVDDYNMPSSREPYRYVRVTLEVDYERAAPRIAEFGVVAIETRGYFTMHTSGGNCALQASVSRPLGAEEARPVANESVSVPLDRAVVDDTAVAS